MPYFLVRFERSLSDDKEYVEERGGLTPENYLAQLMDELTEGGFGMPESAKLTHFESPPMKDTYYLFVWLFSDDVDRETFACRLQCAYDEGSVAGWFQTITKGMPT